MREDIRTNFEEKVSYLARRVPGMTVTDHSGFLAVDCGLPSDTFNVLVIRDMAALTEALAVVDRFNAKGFPLAVWYWGNDIAEMDRVEMARHGLEHTETHVAMYADLSQIQASPLPDTELEITPVTTADDLLCFGEAIGALFGNSDEGEQVRAYFQRLSAYPPETFPAMRYYLGRLHGEVIATSTLFVGSQTTGIYDIVTHPDYRRRGFGSAMFQHILNEAGRDVLGGKCVLQASTDGLDIYQRAGFRAVGHVHTFENRRSLSN
ncbi:N-acetyltransferase [Dictyobacter sp. S3.2.2.5]|uniref:N-acetyltransferase n=1 Tax=Dictyobacter halimunensis TaxID=3026934 RepID=A0ABQ6G244_9CHLR|nr:N-acetyltransferase [Dictyobacter sp. S3.2.2.5]